MFLFVAFDLGRASYIYIYVSIYIYNTWNPPNDPCFDCKRPPCLFGGLTDSPKIEVSFGVPGCSRFSTGEFFHHTTGVLWFRSKIYSYLRVRCWQSPQKTTSSIGKSTLGFLRCSFYQWLSFHSIQQRRSFQDGAPLLNGAFITYNRWSMALCSCVSGVNNLTKVDL